MNDEILPDPDISGQPEKLCKTDKQTFKRALKHCIPHLNPTYHTTDITGEAFKGYLDAQKQLILSNRKTTNIFLYLYFASQSALMKHLKISVTFKNQMT